MTWRIREGAEQGFSEIVLRNLDAAYNLARWLVRDPVQAEDVVQDAVLRALTYFQSYRGGNPRAWLLRIVRNTAYSALDSRQQGVRGMQTGEGLDGEDVRDLPDPGADPEAALSVKQDMARLEEALVALPPELRECLVLKELEELSYKEIAEVTGVPVGTVMSRLWRARQKLLGFAVEGGAR